MPDVMDYDGAMPIGVIGRQRDHWFYAQLAVPQPPVMGADVADRVECEQPGTKDGIRQTNASATGRFSLRWAPLKNVSTLPNA